MESAVAVQTKRRDPLDRCSPTDRRNGKVLLWLSAARTAGGGWTRCHLIARYSRIGGIASVAIVEASAAHRIVSNASRCSPRGIRL